MPDLLDFLETQTEGVFLNNVGISWIPPHTFNLKDEINEIILRRYHRKSDCSTFQF